MAVVEVDESRYMHCVLKNCLALALVRSRLAFAKTPNYMHEHDGSVLLLDGLGSCKS